MIKAGLAAMLIFAAAPAAVAQSTPPQPAPPPPCAGPEYRQLDFWVGEWKVFDTAKGTPVGTSRIERIMNGCSIMESYDAPNAPGGAYAGASYSGYSRLDHKWHQMYVDRNGNVGLYLGGLDGSDMVLVAPARGGGLQRMTYRPHPDGSVEQIGVISTDGGATWSAGYDYTYRRS
jgi:hypothetical protein